MPKSASTFLSNAIAEITGFRKVVLVPEFGRREQEFCEARLAEYDDLDYVAQQHIRNSKYSTALCRTHNVDRIVLIRSLFDIVVSLRDHSRRESPVSPILYLNSSHLALNDLALENMICRLAVPWYINFYLSWRDAGDVKIVQYEDLIADPAATLQDILKFSGISVNRESVEGGIARTKERNASRLNVGVKGRGAQLAPETVQTILDMLDFYPEIAGDIYVARMRAQASGILEATDAPLDPALAQRYVPAQASSKRLVNRAPKWLKQLIRETRRLGNSPRRAIGAALIAFGFAYYFLFRDLIPDTTALGQLDNVVVPIGLGYAAGRFLTRRTKLLRVKADGKTR